MTVFWHGTCIIKSNNKFFTERGIPEMRRFLIASHGRFAEGIYDSLRMIMGEQKNVATLCAYVDHKKDIKEEVKQIIASLAANEELIVITDLFGGSVNNEFMRYLSDWRIHLISGLNLPLLIELVGSAEDELPTNEWLLQKVNSTKNTIQYCNELLRQQELVEEENF
jgi:fructoselysine/glucoselysine PTS system EIIA component